MRSIKMQRREVVGWAVAACAAAVIPFAIPVLAQTMPVPANHTVEIQNFVFSPKTLSVKAGDRITWINKDIVPHTATAADTSWDTGNLKLNESGTVTVTKDMVTGYFCRFHPSMKGKVTVR
jgi:plastocyanin